MHFEHAAKALVANKHVMVEKPVALTHGESQRLAALSNSAGKILSVFHNRRWDIDFLTVKSEIESGRFGRVFNVESRLGQWASCVGPAAREWRPNWRNESVFGGGGLYDWGSHFVDQMLLLMSPAKPETVFAQLRANVWSSDPDCDDFARVCINFDNGAVALVEINTTTTRPLPRWHIDGERGSADGPFSLKFDTREWAKLMFTPAGEVDGQPIAMTSPGLTKTQIWDRFAGACRSEGDPAVTIESVLPTMLVLDAARQSARTGQSVRVMNS
jgi:predicted dehydrogenase